MPLDLACIQAICFDVDGTLRDTDDQYMARFAKMLRPFRFILPGRDHDHVARRLVMRIEAPANWLFSIPDRLHLDDELAACGDWLHKRRAAGKPHEYLIIPGIKEMLTALRPHYKMAVVSARPKRGTLGFLDHYGLTPLFDCIATGQTTPRTKPRPDPVLWAAAQMGVPPENCLMVGDTTVDIRAGKSAGAQTVGVLCGFGERNELEKWGATEILETTAELAGRLSGGNAHQ